MRVQALGALLVLLAGCSSPFADDGDGDDDAVSDPTGSTTDPATTAGTTSTASPGTAATNDPSPSTAPTEESWSVFLLDDAFEDGNLTIAAGDTIVYTNVGDHEHRVAIRKEGDPADAVRVDKALLAGESVDAVFEQTGTYHVWCRNHGTMTTGMASFVTVH